MCCLLTFTADASSSGHTGSEQVESLGRSSQIRTLSTRICLNIPIRSLGNSTLPVVGRSHAKYFLYLLKKTSRRSRLDAINSLFSVTMRLRSRSPIRARISLGALCMEDQRTEYESMQPRCAPVFSITLCAPATNSCVVFQCPNC